MKKPSLLPQFFKNKSMGGRVLHWYTSYMCLNVYYSLLFVLCLTINHFSRLQHATAKRYVQHTASSPLSLKFQMKFILIT